MRIKNCLFISKQLEAMSPKKQQQQQILKSFEEVDKALDSLP